MFSDILKTNPALGSLLFPYGIPCFQCFKKVISILEARKSSPECVRRIILLYLEYHMEHILKMAGQMVENECK